MFFLPVSLGAEPDKDQLRCISSPVDQKPVCDCSIGEVIANQDAWHGKRVRLIGYLHLQFEYDALWLGKNDFDVGITRNGIWVNTEDAKVSRETFSKCTGGYALLE